MKGDSEDLDEKDVLKATLFKVSDFIQERFARPEVTDDQILNFALETVEEIEFLTTENELLENCLKSYEPDESTSFLINRMVALPVAPRHNDYYILDEVCAEFRKGSESVRGDVQQPITKISPSPSLISSRKSEYTLASAAESISHDVDTEDKRKIKVPLRKRIMLLRNEREKIINTVTKAMRQWKSGINTLSVDILCYEQALENINKVDENLEKKFINEKPTHLMARQFYYYLRSYLKSQYQLRVYMDRTTEELRTALEPTKDAVRRIRHIMQTVRPGDFELLAMKVISFTELSTSQDKDVYELRRLKGWFGEEMFLSYLKYERKRKRIDEIIKRTDEKQISSLKRKVELDDQRNLNKITAKRVEQILKRDQDRLKSFKIGPTFDEYIMDESDSLMSDEDDWGQSDQKLSVASDDDEIVSVDSKPKVAETQENRLIKAIQGRKFLRSTGTDNRFMDHIDKYEDVYEAMEQDRLQKEGVQQQSTQLEVENGPRTSHPEEETPVVNDDEFFNKLLAQYTEENLHLTDEEFFDTLQTTTMRNTKALEAMKDESQDKIESLLQSELSYEESDVPPSTRMTDDEDVLKRPECYLTKLMYHFPYPDVPAPIPSFIELHTNYSKLKRQVRNLGYKTELLDERLREMKPSYYYKKPIEVPPPVSKTDRCSRKPGVTSVSKHLHLKPDYF